MRTPSTSYTDELMWANNIANRCDVAERRRSTPEGPPHGPGNAEIAAPVASRVPIAALKAELESLGKAITPLAVVLYIPQAISETVGAHYVGVSGF